MDLVRYVSLVFVGLISTACTAFSVVAWFFLSLCDNGQCPLTLLSPGNVVFLALSIGMIGLMSMMYFAFLIVQIPISTDKIDQV